MANKRLLANVKQQGGALAKKVTYRSLSWIICAAQEIEDGLGDAARDRYALRCVKLSGAEDTNGSEPWVAGGRVGFKTPTAPTRDSNTLVVNVSILIRTGNLVDPVGGSDKGVGGRRRAGGGTVVNYDHNPVARDLIVELRNTRAAIATSADAPHYNGYLKVVWNGGGEKYGLARETGIGEISLFVIIISYSGTSLSGCSEA